jgi:hypothetical protein
MLNVVMLSVVAPKKDLLLTIKLFFTEDLKLLLFTVSTNDIN